jgi:aldehyde dehydrogenase (NAD+)
MSCGEVFGPVLSVISFTYEDDAVRIANDSLFGLAAGVWTQDLRRAIALPQRLRAGTVWVNAHRVVSYLSPSGPSATKRSSGRKAAKLSST